MHPSVTIESLGPVPVGTIYAIGRNYAEHARELDNPAPQGEPVVFIKASSSVRSLLESPLAHSSEPIHYETELVIRIGKTICMGQSRVGWDAVDALTLGLDLTRRAKQSELKANGLPWTLAKSFTGAAVLAPFIPLAECVGVTHFEFRFFLNDTLRQTGDTRQMIFDVPTILTFLASSNDLLAGDLIFTGTPAGVGPMQKGDHFTLELLNPKRRWQGVL
jgi:2-keto-4-pentenoate hydratase/2-oxohepta-3-ene-1,7-dioic acid hydratase in catechol pathway